MPRSVVLTLVLPLALGAGAIAAILALFSRLFVLADPAPVHGALALAAGVLVLARVSSWIDRPAGWGAALGSAGTGVALGLAGFALLRGLFEVPPGGEASFAWAIACGAGLGLFQGHRHVLRHLRQKGTPPRLVLGVLDPRELGALLLLVVGYGLFGLAAHRLFVAFGAFIPEAPKALTLGIAVYALWGAKLLLGFAAHDGGQTEPGFVGWMKANAVRNALVVLLLVAYLAYRDDLASRVPFFPLVEFGLGMAVFAFVLARLRHRLQREKADRSTASEARPHEQKVETLSEGEYEAVSRPIARFVETGRGRAEYARVVRESSRLDAPEADAVLARVERWREPPERPPLPLAWSVLSTLPAGVLVAIGAGVLAAGLADAPLDVALQLGVATGSLFLFALVDPARAHGAPWLGVGFAGAGALTLGLAALWALAGVDTPGWVEPAIVAAMALAVAVPALKAYREARSPPPEPPTRAAPTALLDERRRKARSWAAACAGALAVALLLVPFVLGWLASRMAVWQPDAAGWQELPRVYNDVLAGAVWILLGLGGAAIARDYALGEARPRVAEDERARRAARLALHKETMGRLERV